LQPFDSECVLLYGYETCLTVRVERLSLFHKRVLRKMFGPKKEEVT